MNDWCSFKVFDGTGPITCARHPLYIVWTHMFQRCYHKKHQRKDYIGCTIDSRFHRFADFATWALEQIGASSQGFEIDKDILVRGNRVYGPDTCAFVPREINKALTGCVRRRDMPNDLPLGVRKVPRKIERQFCAEVSRNGKGVHLGYFDTAEQASLAYNVAKESIIKELAKKHQSAIDPRVYVALMSYTA